MQACWVSRQQQFVELRRPLQIFTMEEAMISFVDNIIPNRKAKAKTNIDAQEEDRAPQVAVKEQSPPTPPPPVEGKNVLDVFGDIEKQNQECYI